jgi:hypothetical protein
MNPFDFTPEELNLNKQGRLSDRQREVLQMTARGVRASSQTSVYVIVGFTVFGMCLILGMYLQNESTRAALLSDPRNLLWFPAIVLIIAIILVFSVLFARSISKKLLDAPIQVAEGKIRLDQEYSTNAGFTSYYVFVGRKKFSFADDMSRVFKEAERYKVYYCKANVYELIMSYEKL